MDIEFIKNPVKAYEQLKKENKELQLMYKVDINRMHEDLERYIKKFAIQIKALEDIRKLVADNDNSEDILKIITECYNELRTRI